MKKEAILIAKYRLQEAVDTLNEARILLEKNMNRGAMNRVYYSMFYAALSLLVTRQLSASKHSGVISIFHREFVNKNIFPKELGKYLDLAFDMRTKSDYRELVDFGREEIEEILKGAEAFVEKIKEILEDIISRE